MLEIQRMSEHGHGPGCLHLMTQLESVRCSVSGLFLVPFCTVHIRNRLRSPLSDSTTVYSVSCVQQPCSCECHVMAAMKHANVLRIECTAYSHFFSDT